MDITGFDCLFDAVIERIHIGHFAALAVIRDFKIWYGKALVRRQIEKITSSDVMTRLPVRLSRRSLAFYLGKVPGFTYSSLREYKPTVNFSF